jgi:hypothetical protein
MRNLNEIETTKAPRPGQMEMGFAGPRGRRAAAATNRQRRAQRAQWWFGQMRRVVDGALDWRTPPARPEQSYLTLLGRRS